MFAISMNSIDYTVDVYKIYTKLTFFLTGERPSVTAVPSDWNNVRQCLMSRVGGVSINEKWLYQSMENKDRF